MKTAFFLACLFLAPSPPPSPTLWKRGTPKPTKGAGLAFIGNALKVPLFHKVGEGGGEGAASELTAGVHALAAPGLPGTVCAFGPTAFPLVLGRAGKNTLEPVVAAGLLGKGRVVAFGHTGYLDADTLATGDTAQFLENAVRWASQGKNGTIACLSNPGLAAYLMQRGMKAESVGVRELTPEKLAGVSVLCGTFSVLPAAPAVVVQQWIRSGGGAIGAETGWGWQQLNPNASLEQNRANLLFAPAGIVWTDGTADKTRGEMFAVDVNTSPLTQATSALDALTRRAAPLSPSDTAQAVWTLSRAAQSLPTGDTLLLPRLTRLEKTASEGDLNLAKNPVTLADPLRRLAMTLDLRREMRLPADKVTASPYAASFPGPVPADAPRPSQTLEIDTSVPEWHSTGLYAAPGEKITVAISSQAALRGLRVRIGAHRDGLWNLDKWPRAPEITRTFPLAPPQIVAANAFGGPIYIEVPANAAPGKLTVTISGAVAAPYFVKGKTRASEWKALRNAPAPWAELQGDRVILTVPSYAVRALDDPDELMAYWDRVYSLAAELYAVPGSPARPERYCADREISAGYMHSGYPIMTHDDVARTFTDLSLLAKQGPNKSWGFYHELGHNFQQGDWTFGGTGEVTNNLFSLYAEEKINGMTTDGHPAMNPAKMAVRLQKYLADGAKFDEWKSDPFLALTMYSQLQKAFGWESFQKVFAAYRVLPNNERPKTDDEKRDQWMVRFSRQVGKNLGPFFAAWGVPTSESARKSLADLPVWMPSDFPKPYKPPVSIAK